MKHKQTPDEFRERMDDIHGPALTIDSFRGDYHFLSNFFIEPDGTCVEVEYQAFKGSSLMEMAHVFRSYDDYEAEGAGTPAHLSKRRGRKVKLFAPSQWTMFSVQVMGFLVLKKFMDHAGLAQRLFDTGDAHLIEGNTWGDTTWGMVKRGGKWVGSNFLGEILMDVRDTLRDD